MSLFQIADLSVDLLMLNLDFLFQKLLLLGQLGYPCIFYLFLTASTPLALVVIVHQQLKHLQSFRELVFLGITLVTLILGIRIVLAIELPLSSLDFLHVLESYLSFEFLKHLKSKLIIILTARRINTIQLINIFNSSTKNIAILIETPHQQSVTEKRFGVFQPNTVDQSQQFYIYKPMASLSPIQCHICGTFYLQHDQEDHMNLHRDPSSLAPKTSPNDLRKIELAKVLHAQEENQQTDIALRSLLPDQIPQPEHEKKNVGAPSNEDDLRNETGSGAGAHRISEAAFRQMQNRDRLDLTSKLAVTSLSKDELNKLEIQKQVQIRPITKMVPKKQIHKYQNEPYSNKQIRDLGACEKKIAPGKGMEDSGRRVGSGQQGLGESQPGYRVVSDSSNLKNGAQKEAIFVPINRKTVDPKDYNQVDTKLNESNVRRRGVNNEEPYDSQSGKKVGGQQGFYGSSSSRVKPYEPQEQRYGQGQGHGHTHGSHGLHPHECPDCHGFYCRTCHATIPPQYRPFWDEDQSPEMVQFYKKRIRQQRERERKQRAECKECNMPPPQVQHRHYH